jgi:hypothetical protein
MADEENGSGQREGPSSPLTQQKCKNLFSCIKIHKGVDCPLLYREDGGTYVKLDAGDGPAWLNKTTRWLRAHGVKAVFPLANALVKLNEEGTKLLPSYLDDPSMEDFSTNGKGMLETLVKVP